MKRRLFAAAFLLLTAALFLPEAAIGANTRGIGLSPGVQELVLLEGDKSAEFPVAITNLTDETMNLQLSLLDFGTLDESGGVAFLGRSGQDVSDYGLRQWMRLDKDRLTLEPDQTGQVQVTIVNQETLHPGGHYGAVVVSAVGGAVSGGESVSVHPAASTLVLLKKKGGEVESLKLSDINTNSSLIDLPKTAELKFENTGNVHVVPRGTMELFGPTGAKISRSFINETSAYVLPDASRRFQQDLSRVSQPWLPGRYRLVTTWRFDGRDDVEVIEKTYWYMGRLVLYGLITLSLVFVLFMYIKYRRRPPTRY